MSLQPFGSLRRDKPPLDRREYGFALGDRQPDVLRPLRRLRECRHLLDSAGGAGIIADLKQDPDAHDALR